MFVSKLKSSTLCIIVSLVFTNEGRLQCRDDDNNPVDWIVAYKLPSIKTSSYQLIRKGLGYTFITSKTLDNGWTVSKKSMNQSDSFLGYSLKALYETTSKTLDKDLLWLLYNDETPNKTVTFELGHTKGVVLAEPDGGLWLVHSVPRYPPIPGTPKSAYSYPISGTHYGQSFLCISLNIDQLDLVGRQLQYNEPQVYSSNIPTSLEKSLSNLAAVAKKIHIHSAPWYHQVQLSSVGGVIFTSFSKTKEFKKDLYADWVAPTLKSSLLVETWPNGKGRLPSECEDPYTVKNVEHISLRAANADFKSHRDHSKWGVGDDNTTAWVCVGDINRMESQEVRGGGTVCMNNLKLWTAYRNTVQEVEPCKQSKQKFPYLLAKYFIPWNLIWKLVG